MKKVMDYIDKYYLNGYNCAETVLLAANDAWDLDLSEDTIHVMAGFGGGMGTGNACGAITGGVAALSTRFVNGKAHNSPQMMQYVREFINTVNEHCGTTMCQVLKPIYFKSEIRCLNTIKTIVAYLDEIYEKAISGEEHE